MYIKCLFIFEEKVEILDQNTLSLNPDQKVVDPILGSRQKYWANIQLFMDMGDLLLSISSNRQSKKDQISANQRDHLRSCLKRLYLNKSMCNVIQKKMQHAFRICFTVQHPEVMCLLANSLRDLSSILSFFNSSNATNQDYVWGFWHLFTK